MCMKNSRLMLLYFLNEDSRFADMLEDHTCVNTGLQRKMEESHDTKALVLMTSLALCF